MCLEEEFQDGFLGLGQNGNRNYDGAVSLPEGSVDLPDFLDKCERKSRGGKSFGIYDIQLLSHLASKPLTSSDYRKRGGEYYISPRKMRKILSKIKR